MSSLERSIKFLSSLKVAIILLIVIAAASAIGTIIPQEEPLKNYLELYTNDPWLGFINGKTILLLQLNHIYSSIWFIFLLIWLGLALTICSFRRQLPSLQASMNWVDYKQANQIKKLAISEIIKTDNLELSFQKLIFNLQSKGWKVKEEKERLAARKGLISKVGPLMVHLGLISLMFGSIIGVLNGDKLERFITPNQTLDFINKEGVKELSIKLKSFNIDRSPDGNPEQFKSQLELNESKNKFTTKEISVNHPLRYKGLTIYQADWALNSLLIKINKKQSLQINLTKFPELGDQIWGVIIPTKENNEEPVFLSISNEEGPVKLFDKDGNTIDSLRVGESPKRINNIDIQLIKIISSSGLLIKKDPGVPLVYFGFMITMIGGALSIFSTKQIWAISDSNINTLYIGGLSNRNIPGLKKEILELSYNLKN